MWGWILSSRNDNETMISVYFVASLVFGIVLCYLWLIHHFWLRHVFKEDHQPSVHTRKWQATSAV